MNQSIFVWNCQGAASNKFHTVLKSLLQGFKPAIIALVEPRISGYKADKVIQKLNYPNSHRVESEGFSGGIWLLWIDQVKVQILVNHKQFIHSRICDVEGRLPFLFTAIYGSPNPVSRNLLWRELLQLNSGDQEAWLLAGDFNAIRSNEERRGGTRHAGMGNKAFKEFIDSASLMDLGYTGPRFTWKRGNLFVRLDRALSNQKWISN
ncbi:uncharacterized protein LOC114753260 [Neltuma alba]|uniref:uncharacterized protein LOC114753260 n=1 Tax=Neltuma alba TaxID=207710 RepID=UPI0010A47E31|nr:uncharacterized protein LOC114753260 [Prosopis alba]